MKRLVPSSGRLGPWAALLVLGACLAWGSWSVIAEMAKRWAEDPTYSHGYLVPLVAAAILWSRRDEAPGASARPAWRGVLLIGLGAALQVAGAFYFVRWLCGAAVVVYLCGVAVLFGGRGALRWSAPALGFLVFMVPLPWSVEVLMRQPLQRLSAVAGGYALEVLGLPAVTEGNVIVLDQVEIGVIDACSGLKMLVVFFCLATAVAILSRRRLVDKALIVLSAAPIAVACNVARITATGVLHVVAGEKWADLVFHDLAGWVMMPLALGMLWCVLALLSHLWLQAEPATAAFRQDRSDRGAFLGSAISQPPAGERPALVN